jgi:RNA polymerase sigma factor (sigma-70 family)
MKDSISIPANMQEARNETVKETFQRERKRLLAFIRKRVPDRTDAEDILQDVFFQLTENLEILKPIEQMTAWLFRVARNKIIDRYRKKKPDLLDDMTVANDDSNDRALSLTDLLFDPQDNPEDTYLRSLVWEELALALEELPAEQREVFEMHELEAKSFKEIAQITGASINTLLSRKRYAVLYLRKRLEDLYNDLLNN